MHGWVSRQQCKPIWNSIALPGNCNFFVCGWCLFLLYRFCSSWNTNYIVPRWLAMEMKCAFVAQRSRGIDVACLEGFCLVAFCVSGAVRVMREVQEKKIESWRVRTIDRCDGPSVKNPMCSRKRFQPLDMRWRDAKECQRFTSTQLEGKVWTRAYLQIARQIQMADGRIGMCDGGCDLSRARNWGRGCDVERWGVRGIDSRGFRKNMRSRDQANNCDGLPQRKVNSLNQNSFQFGKDFCLQWFYFKMNLFVYCCHTITNFSSINISSLANLNST